MENIPKPIVHIAPDEKFIDAAYDVYETAFPRMNLFIILSHTDSPKYISEEKEYELISVNQEFTHTVSLMVSDADLIVFHGMNEEQSRLAMKLDGQYKLIWTVFGIEVYNNRRLMGSKIYGKKTFKTFFSRFFSIKNMFRGVYYRLIKGEKHAEIETIEAFKKMDFVSTIYKEEYQFFKQVDILKPEVAWLKFTYYPLDIVVEKESNFIQGNDILLGNSAFPSGNHLEAFDLLKELELVDRRIIVPLSYGQSKYREAILERGSEIFGQNFYPLLDFLPLEEYQQLTQSCGIVIMNNYRPQAVGNIIDLMYRGAKVYLSKKNTFFHYLKRIGTTVCCIEKQIESNSEFLRPLSVEQMEENRRILKGEISMEIVCTDLRKKIGPLLKNN